MAKNELLRRLSTILPDYRQRLENAQNLVFDALRWQVRTGVLLRKPENKALICQFLRELSEDALQLAGELESMPCVEPQAMRQVSMTELKMIAQRFDPSWQGPKWGWPRNGWREHMLSLGGVWNEKRKAWFLPVTKT